jgi:hypothetical protein
MTTTINAKALSQIQYTFRDQNGLQTTQSSDTSANSSDYTYGTGNLQVNSIVKTTGVIASGSSISLNFNSYPFILLNGSGNITFSKIKSIVVNNTSTSSGIDLNVRATGANAATGFFNTGSGNLLIKPYSSFIYNDPFDGVNVSTGYRLQIHNVSTASGSTSGIASYEITVMGIK